VVNVPGSPVPPSLWLGIPNHTGRTRNPRGEGGRLREEIVAAASRLIEEKGEEAVTLRAIARSAGITAPSIYAYFEDLDEVLEAMVANTFDAWVTYLRRYAAATVGVVAAIGFSVFWTAY
jgi:AcrR family transcriptional regulator